MAKASCLTSITRGLSPGLVKTSYGFSHDLKDVTFGYCINGVLFTHSFLLNVKYYSPSIAFNFG